MLTFAAIAADARVKPAYDGLGLAPSLSAVMDGLDPAIGRDRLDADATMLTFAAIAADAQIKPAYDGLGLATALSAVMAGLDPAIDRDRQGAGATMLTFANIAADTRVKPAYDGVGGRLPSPSWPDSIRPSRAAPHPRMFTFAAFPRFHGGG